MGGLKGLRLVIVRPVIQDWGGLGFSIQFLGLTEGPMKRSYMDHTPIARSRATMALYLLILRVVLAVDAGSLQSCMSQLSGPVQNILSVGNCSPEPPKLRN